VFTRPDDLPDDTLLAAMRDNWDFWATSLTYEAVGFGGHHWLAVDARGGRLFVTVDDLTDKLRSPDDTTDAAFGRLERAFIVAFPCDKTRALTSWLRPCLGLMAGYCPALRRDTRWWSTRIWMGTSRAGTARLPKPMTGTECWTC
jgi:hypothetical protein